MKNADAGIQLAEDRADGSRGNCLVEGSGDDRAGDHEDREDCRKSEHSEDDLQSSHDRTYVFYAARSAGKRDKRIVCSRCPPTLMWTT